MPCDKIYVLVTLSFFSFQLNLIQQLYKGKLKPTNHSSICQGVLFLSDWEINWNFISRQLWLLKRFG